MEEKTIIVEQERRDAETSLRRGIREIQEQITELQKIAEWVTPKDIKTISYDYFRGLVAHRIDAVRSDISLTEKERQERLIAWRGVCAQVGRHTSRIVAVVEAWPEVTWLYDDAVRNFVPTSDLNYIVEARSTHNVPLVAQQHFQLIQEAMNAVQKLRGWEEEHNIKTMPLQSLVFMDLAQITEGYLNSTIFINKKYGYRVDSKALKRLIV